MFGSAKTYLVELQDELWDYMEISTPTAPTVIYSTTQYTSDITLQVFGLHGGRILGRGLCLRVESTGFRT